MSALDDHLKAHRRKIIEREEQTFREILAAYDEIEQELKRAYRELQKKIIDARAAGEEISPSWVYRERRLRKLLDQVNEQIVRFGGRITPIIMREQRAAIQLAIEYDPDPPFDAGAPDKAPAHVVEMIRAVLADSTRRETAAS